MSKQLLEIVIVSTMSSGKSTFINALLGKELLATMNKSCTSKILRIIHNADIDDYIAHITLNGGYNVDVKVSDESVVEMFNKNNEVEEVVIEGNIKGISSYNYNFTLIDTPGINNSQRDEDGNTTFKFLSKFESGVILFLINVNQIGTNDEKNILLKIKEKLSNNKDINILFVVNKMDNVDYHREDSIELMKNINSYLLGLGFDNNKIYTLSSRASLIFKKILKEEELTIQQQIEFLKYYELFKSTDWDLRNLCMIEDDFDKVYTILNRNYSYLQIKSALNNSGITRLENDLVNYILR